MRVILRGEVRVYVLRNAFLPHSHGKRTGDEAISTSV